MNENVNEKGLAQYLVDFFEGVMQSFLAVLSVIFICWAIFSQPKTFRQMDNLLILQYFSKWKRHPDKRIFQSSLISYLLDFWLKHKRNTLLRSLATIVRGADNYELFTEHNKLWILFVILILWRIKVAEPYLRKWATTKSLICAPCTCNAAFDLMSIKIIGSNEPGML